MLNWYGYILLIITPRRFAPIRHHRDDGRLSLFYQFCFLFLVNGVAVFSEAELVLLDSPKFSVGVYV